MKGMKECGVNIRPKTFQSYRSRDFETGSGRKRSKGAKWGHPLYNHSFTHDW